MIKFFKIFAFIFFISICIYIIYFIYDRETTIAQQILFKENEWLTKEKIWKDDILKQELENKELRKLANDPYKGRTLLLENKLVLQNYTPNANHAIVTMIGFPSEWHPYWMGAVALIQSLREVQTRVPNIIIMVRVSEFLPKFAKEAFERLGAQLIRIDNINTSELGVDIPGTWEGAFDKLNVWSLTQFEKVLFLDADTLIVQNIDHLFNEDEMTAPITPRGCRCYVDYINQPEFFSISSGFFICKPSLETFSYMIELAGNPSPDPDDLEQFGGTWHWGDQEMLHVVFYQLSDLWNRLNWQYDVPVGTCSCKEKRNAPVYSYHFVCSYPLPKPWYDPFKPMYAVGENKPDDCVLEVFNLWFRMFAKATNSHEINEIVRTPEQLLEEVKINNNGVVWT